MIPGLKQIGVEPMTAPIIGVMAREKSGKSVLATTLFDYPVKGKMPLVLAFDKTGPVSAAKLGRPLSGIVVEEEPGLTYQQKTWGVLQKLEQHVKGKSTPFNSIVIDCQSTMAEHLLEEIRRTSKNPDPRSHYGTMNDVCKSFFWRVTDMGLPTIWITWLKEPETVAEGRMQRWVPGGPQIPGQQFARMFAGKCHALVFLEKRQPQQGDPQEFICSDGMARILHTKQFAGINCEARFALPEPMPAHLGMLLHYVAQPFQPAAQQATT